MIKEATIVVVNNSVITVLKIDQHLNALDFFLKLYTKQVLKTHVRFVYYVTQSFSCSPWGARQRIGPPWRVVGGDF